MVRYRRVRQDGRSSGAFIPRIKKVLRPPEGEPWVWHARSMLESPAWRALGINGRRFIEFLEIEHMSHGGAENGRLKAPYDQLTAFGLTRELIPEAIDETEALGLVRRTRPRQMRVAMTYRLTWIGTITPEGVAEEPTNEWKTLSQEAVAQIVADRKQARQRHRNWRTRKQNGGPGNGSNWYGITNQIPSSDT